MVIIVVVKIENEVKLFFKMENGIMDGFNVEYGLYYCWLDLLVGNYFCLNFNYFYLIRLILMINFWYFGYGFRGVCDILKIF